MMRMSSNVKSIVQRAAYGFILGAVLFLGWPVGEIFNPHCSGPRWSKLLLIPALLINVPFLWIPFAGYVSLLFTVIAVWVKRPFSRFGVAAIVAVIVVLGLVFGFVPTCIGYAV
jgi:hypothetical protein